MTSLRLTNKGIRIFLLSFFLVLYATSCQNGTTETGDDPGIMVEIDFTYHAMNPMDLQFDSIEQTMIDSGMADLMDADRAIRAYAFQLPPPTEKIKWEIPEGISKPSWEADLAFMSIPELASLIHSGEISCLALTQFFLNRMKI